MSRKETRVIIHKGGRDFGKVFVICKMPEALATKWTALVACGLMAVLKMKNEDVEALLDEMMSGIAIVPDPKYPQRKRLLRDDDIEEVATRISLRALVLKDCLERNGDSGKSATLKRSGFGLN